MKRSENNAEGTLPVENVPKPHPYDDPKERLRARLITVKWEVEYCLTQLEEI